MAEAGLMRATFAFALTAVAALSVLTLVPAIASHDNAIYLEYARRLIEGGRPYIDFVDTNPPLIVYLNALPALLERATGLSSFEALRFCVTALTLGSLFMIRSVLRRGLAGEEHGGVAAEAAAALLLAGALLFSVSYDYGQREHAFVLLALPFVCVRWARSATTELPILLAATAGLLAGIGVSLKPHFGVLIVLVEGLRLLRQRDLASLFRPEVLAFPLPIAAYAIHLATLPDDQSTELFGRWLPQVVESYSVYGDSPVVALKTMRLWCYAFIALAALRAGSGARDRLADLTRTLAWFTLLALVVVYVGQQKFFPYHAVPALFGAYATFALLAVGYLVRAGTGSATLILLLAAVLGLGGEPAFRGAVALGATAVAVARLWPGARLVWNALPLVAVAATVPYLVVFLHRQTPETTPFGRAVLEHTDPGDPVLVLSTNVWPASPYLMQLERTHASRYLVAFPIAFNNRERARGADGRFPYPRRERVEGEELRFVRELGEDVERYRPKLVLVEHDGGAQACPPGFDVGDYLEHLGFYATELADYRRGAMAGAFQAFVRER